MTLNPSYPKPKDVFDDPDLHWEFLTSPDDNLFEGQFFERKEAGTVNQKLDIKSIHEKIKTVISAFANQNRLGGLFVLGISDKGKVYGLNHLKESDKIDLTKLDDLLVHHSATVKFHPCKDLNGNNNDICLIYVPYAEHFICETVGNNPKAWERQGMKNAPLSFDGRERLIREKRITDFEITYCCPYDPSEISKSVLDEFRKHFLINVNKDMNDEEMLLEAGALIKDKNGYAFTYAGYLFFANNPQRKLSWSYIRLLRFGQLYQPNSGRILSDFSREFSGPIPEQIRSMRSFFRDSGFFKIYQRRKIDGGFIEEPELPFIAVDEAIVNAVAHRDYAIKLPIECEHYNNALLVINPGRLQQRDLDVPDRFTLQELSLNHKPKNPKILEWLKLMKEKDGTAFVKAVSEGTWQMQRQMDILGLPSPEYIVSSQQTKLILISNAPEREASIQNEILEDYTSTYYTNLFELRIESRSKEVFENFRRDFTIALKNSLESDNWYIDKNKFSELIAHKRGNNIRLPEKLSGFVGLYPAYVFQVREYWDRYYLCIDYKLEVKNLKSLQSLLELFSPSEFINLFSSVKFRGWQNGKIISLDNDKKVAKVFLFDYNDEELIDFDKIIPSLPKHMLNRLMELSNTDFDLSKAIKEHSLSSQTGASRIRAEKTIKLAEYLVETIFPLSVNDSLKVSLVSLPTTLFSRHPNAELLQVYTLPEPKVEFYKQQESSDILDGITRFGSYESQQKIIEIVPICTDDLRSNMISLLEVLKLGKYKYKGAERTFGTRLFYTAIHTVSSTELIYDKCKQLLEENPGWIGDDKLNRIFLIQIPDLGYSLDDERSPYYRIKRLLLENGIPCQMIKGTTILNPDWKDLNLSLNIIAKCGITPWVLPNAIPDADFFIGLSYTENVRRASSRLMGYANVFNQFGKWQFYSANSQTFPYYQKEEYFRILIRQTLERLELSETPSIYFHYSAKFSREDRSALVDEARKIRRKGTYTFVWINTGHNVRFYDRRPESDGSLSRGCYVTTSNRQIFLSTTGNNPYRKALGTPSMLEVNTWLEPPVDTPVFFPDLKSLAVQMLNLTKLN